MKVHLEELRDIKGLYNKANPRKTPMLTYLSGSIWALPALAPVNTVNVVGPIGIFGGKNKQGILMKTCKRCFRKFDEEDVRNG